MVSKNSEGTSPSGGSILRWSSRALLLLGLVFVFVWMGQVVSATLSLLGHLRAAQALREDDPMAVLRSDPQRVEELLYGVRGDVVTLRRNVGPLTSLGPAFGWVPKVGPLLAESEPLLEMADELTEAGVLLWEGGAPLLEAWSSGSLSIEGAASTLAAAQPQIEAAQAPVERALEAHASVDLDALPGRLQSPMAQLEALLPLLADGLAFADVAPEMLGMRGPRTYLILAQNEDELRPTGGFISGAGLIRLTDGRIEQLEFMDASLVDDFANKPYPEPPAPLYDYMGLELWGFRDANWSPDFPTSAQQAMELYELGQGVKIDGVVAIDQRALAFLIEGLGEVRISGMDQSITAANVVDFMRDAWSPDEGASWEWVISRKDFMQQLASALLERILDDPASISWDELLRNIYVAVERRHILLYVRDEEIGRLLRQLNWDAAVREHKGDYLMVVDSNLGYGKVNVLVDRELDYEIQLHPDGTGTANLTLTYTHQGTRPDIACEHLTQYSTSITYDALIHKCYYNYLRVYVPESSELIRAAPHPTPGEYLIREEPTPGEAVRLSSEHGKGVFAQFFVVPYGERRVVKWTYELPQVSYQEGEVWDYSLLIQKQAGLMTMPVSVTVHLPAAMQLQSAVPLPEESESQSLSFVFNQDEDLEIEVLYE